MENVHSRIARNQQEGAASHMTEAQEKTLRNLCERYHVEFKAEHYVTHPADSFMMASWTEGWIGGPGRRTIFVGVSPEGEAHS